MTCLPFLRRASVNRRRFLQMCAAGSAPALAVAGAAACTNGTPLEPGTTANAPAAGGQEPADRDDVDPPAAIQDLELKLTAVPAEVGLLPGAKTRVLTYRAEVIAGDAGAVQTLPDSYLGPFLRVQRGQRVRIHFVNRLDEPSIIHWHGLIVPPEMDGHPDDAVAPGEQYTYTFEVTNRAATYWFHPHPHGLTGGQVYRGLAGLSLVSDEEEQALA